MGGKSLALLVLLLTPPHPENPLYLQIQAEQDRKTAVETFLAWADTMVEGARHMNVASGAQIRQLFFPEYGGDLTK